MTRSRIAKFAWLTLVYNVLVVVWGVFLRASKSGDGCGRYWLTCHGEVIPSAPQLKTVIEFSHRVMSGVDFFVVLALMVCVLVFFRKEKQLRLFSILSFFFIITEALIGAGLVLTGNVAETYTATRPLWAIGHLINTFLLLGSLSLTAVLLHTGGRFKWPAGRTLTVFAVTGTSALVVIGISGAVAALTNMLFPSASFAEGLVKDFAADSHILVRLRILHPIGSLLISVFLGFAAARLKTSYGLTGKRGRVSDIFTVLLVAQVICGALTLFTGAPIIMQVTHLLLADGVWIAWVLLIAACCLESSDDDLAASFSR
ncbi:MAG: COX15/CtaA family protein [Acidobacteriota bacterium]|nr:COX15/CtaA family protein [Acidobacteriota bacterium]MDH3528218.1 COX15/CtaA family protein [Acidobacteriota bacterium]